MVEALLVVVISALLFQRSFKPVSRKGDDLTDKVPPCYTKVPSCIPGFCFDSVSDNLRS